VEVGPCAVQQLPRDHRVGVTLRDEHRDTGESAIVDRNPGVEG